MHATRRAIRLRRPGHVRSLDSRRLERRHQRSNADEDRSDDGFLRRGRNDEFRDDFVKV